MHKPVVTQPSKMINGRFTQGFYKKMGLDKYISNSKEEYVNLAVRLAEDLEFRKTFEQDLKDNNDVLFNDQGTIDDYKEFLLGLKLT
jgi:predicted O-linked N-acetylglucosamine transferase (SPINDLY family)